MDKYVYFIPRGGINDTFTQIKHKINYCKKMNRILLLDMNYGSYNVNVHDYLYFINCEHIIYDMNKIKEIISNKKVSIYPKEIDFSLLDVVNKKTKFIFTYKDINLRILPKQQVNEDIILHTCWGGGDGTKIFIENIMLHENLKEIIKNKLNLLDDHYLCLQIRNTDIQSNYVNLYEENKEMIHSYKSIYLCTDDKVVINFFKNKNLNIFNFTTFSDNKCKNLHNSNIKPQIKFQDLFVDIFIAVNSHKIISNSGGGFAKFIKECFLQKKEIMKKLDYQKIEIPNNTNIKTMIEKKKEYYYIVKNNFRRNNLKLRVLKNTYLIKKLNHDQSQSNKTAIKKGDLLYCTQIDDINNKFYYICLIKIIK
jgi:hypothetical protein